MRFVLKNERTFNIGMITVLLVCVLLSWLNGWGAPPLWLVGTLLAGSTVMFSEVVMQVAQWASSKHRGVK